MEILDEKLRKIIKNKEIEKDLSYFVTSKQFINVDYFTLKTKRNSDYIYFVCINFGFPEFGIPKFYRVVVRKDLEKAFLSVEYFELIKILIWFFREVS